eukprot:602694-Pelagomonas_calceolata.AAC.5
MTVVMYLDLYRCVVPTTSALVFCGQCMQVDMAAQGECLVHRWSIAKSTGSVSKYDGRLTAGLPQRLSVKNLTTTQVAHSCTHALKKDIVSLSAALF